MRLFLAIEIPSIIKEKIAALAQEIGPALPKANVKWVNENNLHITLVFLGETPQERLKALAGATREALREAPVFKATLSGLGAFPKEKAARVLWIGLAEGARQINSLSEKLRRTLHAAAFLFDDKESHAHVTIARFHEPLINHAALLGFMRRPDPALGIWSVQEITLLQSTLTPQGPLYGSIEKFPLRLN